MKALVLLAFLFAIPNVHAIVDMKNANYANSWTDLQIDGTGYDFKVERSYNSRSLFNGMFGFGWCSDFETSIFVNAEGNIRLAECGGGQEITYSPKVLTRADVDKSVNTIIDKVKAEKKVGNNEEFFKKLKTDLVDDENLRAKYARQYGIKSEIKEGTKFFANGSEVENFVFNKTYYTRTLPDGSSQRFDLQGRLTHMYDKNGNFLKFNYEKDQLTTIEDNNNRKLTFKYFPSKKVKSITGPNNVVVEYTFQGLEDLSKVKNAWGKTYTYEYDDLHNLTKAVWPDNTFVAIKYDKKRDWVTSLTDREKCTEEYNYEFDSKTPDDHYWSTVKKTCGKEITAENRFEFWYKTRADGQNYLSRVLTIIDNLTTDISYDEQFGKPLSIRKNKEVTTYEYYKDGQVKLKSNSNAKMNFTYDPKTNKVNKVSTDFFNEKGKKVSTKFTSFKYDDKGNLNYAENDEGQKITMTYDHRGRIATITDQAKKVVKIEYEERFGKPSIVTRPGLGTIKVSYKPNGEINKVESAEGPSVAMQVASTFNNLLDIIAPATAELYL